MCLTVTGTNQVAWPRECIFAPSGSHHVLCCDCFKLFFFFPDNWNLLLHILKSNVVGEALRGSKPRLPSGK